MASSEVQLGNSLLIGSRDHHTGVQKFLGIPYALPPTGHFRFSKPRKLPEDYAYGNGLLDCTRLRPACHQPDNLLTHTGKSIEYSEDCLFLNIWVPADPPPTRGWPVLAWIHGGFYQVGNPLQEVDPTGLLSEAGLQAIVVAIGYRLNIFGFLACRGLKGNFGLWDQRMALEWIHEVRKASLNSLSPNRS